MANRKHVVDLMIFDLDGTLVDTRQDLCIAVNHALHHFGRPAIDVETVTRYVGDGAHQLLARALGESTPAQVEAAVAMFKDHYSRHLSDFSLPYPGIPAVLTHFHAKPKAVLTNKPQEFSAALLQGLALDHHFAMIVGSRPGMKLKPDTEPLQLILHQLGVEAGRAVLIGDGENDVLAGKAADLITCAVTYGYRPAEKLLALAPDEMVHEPLELRELFA